MLVIDFDVSPGYRVENYSQMGILKLWSICALKHAKEHMSKFYLIH